MPPLMAFIIGVMVGNLCGIFLMSLFIVAARADEDAVSYKR
jgi:hypothetical protein